MNPRGKRLESCLPKDHVDPHRGARVPSDETLVRKFVPLTQAMKIPDVKEAVDQESEKLEKLPAWQLDQVHSKQEVILQAQGEK